MAPTDKARVRSTVLDVFHDWLQSSAGIRVFIAADGTMGLLNRKIRVKADHLDSTRIRAVTMLNAMRRKSPSQTTMVVACEAC